MDDTATAPRPSISDIATTTARSTVRIRGAGPRGPRGVGVVVADGLVLTNAHGVPADEARVRFDDGSTATAQVRARDVDGDLAVLGLDTGGRPPLPWADEVPGLGDPVVTVTPGRQGVRVTTGAISSVGRRFRGPGGRPIDDGLEHTAPLARGSSGSPLLDLHGRLVGLNTHRTEPFYLALPVSERLRARVEELGRGEAPARRDLGIAVAPPHVARRLRASVGLDDRAGVLVREVDETGVAAAAGIARGDLLVSADGASLTAPDDLLAVLASGPSELVLGVLRGADEREVTVLFDD